MHRELPLNHQLRHRGPRGLLLRSHPPPHPPSPLHPRDLRTISRTPYSFSTFTFRFLKHSSIRSWKGRRFSDTRFSWILIPAPRKGIWRGGWWPVSWVPGLSVGPGTRGAEGLALLRICPGCSGPPETFSRGHGPWQTESCRLGVCSGRGGRAAAALPSRRAGAPPPGWVFATSLPCGIWAGECGTRGEETAALTQRLVQEVLGDAGR